MASDSPKLNLTGIFAKKTGKEDTTLLYRVTMLAAVNLLLAMGVELILELGTSLGRHDSKAEYTMRQSDIRRTAYYKLHMSNDITCYKM